MTHLPHPQRSTTGRCLARLRGDDRGAAMAVVAMLGTALVLIAAVIVSRQMIEFEVGSSDRDWEEALHVAESGVDEVLYELDQDHEYIENEGLTVAAGTDLSTRDAIVAAAEDLASDVTVIRDTPDGDVIVFEEADQADGKLYAVAFSPSIDAEHRLVRVLETEYHITWNATHAFPPGALVAEGNVDMTGNGNTVTVPSPPHEASVFTNGNYTGSGNASVDGDISAAGTVTGGTAAGDKTSGADPVEFPDDAVVDDWRATLLAEAQTGPTLGNVNSSRVINAPAYIVGSIDLSSGDIVVVNGPGALFVTGGIRMSGQSALINNGAIIATDGNIVQSGQSRYEVQGDPSQAGLITFSSDPAAVKMSGGSSGSAQGIVYVPNGGVVFTGGSWFEGAIIAGDGGVTITGDGSLRYPQGLLDKAAALPPAPDGVELDSEKEITVRKTES